MNKIYVGNLSSDVSVENVTSLLHQHGIEASSIVANKKGFAFVDCVDTVTAEKAIEKLSKLTINGKELSVEHSCPRGSKSKKIQVRNIPSHLNWEDLDKLLAEYGVVDICEQVSTESDSATVNVTYNTRAEAQTAIRELNNKCIDECQLKVSLLPDPADAVRPPRKFVANGFPPAVPFVNGGGPVGYMPKKQQQLPTRMLVPSPYVGAIIGKGGDTIKKITQECEASVDVHRKENPGANEKAVTICGTSDACSDGVRKILEIIREEDRTAKTNAGLRCDEDLPLKLLAHNSLIGRLIGKDGRNLRSIQEKVDTKIAISNLADLTIFNAERTITIMGTVEKCIEAQKLLMDKLRSCYENDMASAFQGPGHMHLGPPHLYGHHSFNSVAPVATQQAVKNESETTLLYIPAQAVGAIIGTKGSHIRNVSRIANASIKISQPENLTEQEKDRKVTITGSPEGQWKAQFCVFDKLKQEGFFGSEEGKLVSEIKIPANVVGRIIGKGGNNVRELQRLTSSEVVIPRQSETEGLTEVPVKINGHFFSIQSAQRKIREQLQKAKEADRIAKTRENKPPTPPLLQ